MQALGNKTNNSIVDVAELIESWIDDYIFKLTHNEYNRKKNLNSLLRAYKPKKSDCKSIFDTCCKFRDELDEVIVDRNPDLIEGYSYLTMSKIKKLREFIDSLCVDIEKYSTITRKKKKLTPERMLRKFKYREALDDATGVLSFDPNKLFTVKTFVAFNVKTNEFFYYTTDNKFEIKGTTLIGFDEEASYSQKVGRKLDDFILYVASSGAAKAGQFLKEITTKKNKCTGRFNLNTMLFRVLK